MSKKATIKILVENFAAINQASNEVKNKTNLEFQEHAKCKLWIAIEIMYLR